MKLISRILALCLTAVSCIATAQSLTGSFSPASVQASTASTLTLNYSGFTPQSSGAVFRLYYNAAAFSSGPTFTSSVSDFQGAGAPTAGTLPACTGADTYMTLNWVNFGNAWPSSATGTLGTVAVTTAASFNANTNMCVADDASSPVARPGVASTYTLNFFVPATAATFTSSPSTLTFAEGGAAQNVTVACSGVIGTPSPVVINVASSNTAFFTVAPLTLSFTTCPSSQTVAVTPRAADLGSNPTQTGNVTFSTATAGATAPAIVGVTVTDNQSPAVYSVTKTTATVTEGNVATDTLTVTCTGAFTGGLTSGSVQYAITNLTNPGDIAAPALTGALNFPACGGATQSITISPRANDSVVQGNKSGTFTISTAAAGTLGTPTTGTINVNDDDTPQTITVAVGGSPATEAGGVLTYTFTRAGGNAGALAAPLTVNVTPPASSARYSTTCVSTITFAGASPTASCTVTGINNAVADGNVNVVVAVAAPTLAGSYVVGAPPSATGVIADDEITVTVTPTGVIEGGVVTFAIACTGPAGASVTGLNFAVTPAQDAGAAPATPGMSGPVGTLTCGTPFVVSVPTFNDTIIGNTRSLTLTLSGTAVGSNNASVAVPTAAAVATVIDNDVPLIVPTMGAWGLGLMSLMLAGLVGFQRRRLSK
jgi:hypothetical protein